MPNHSYEDFFYVEDQQLHSVYEVQKEYEQKKGDISKYRDKMLCPECQISNLRFTHKTSERRAFFLPFVKSIKALSKKRDKTVTILRLLSYF